MKRKPAGWPELRRATPARIGLGRSGMGLPTAAHLDFQRAHALARDAVNAGLATERLLTELADAGLAALALRSEAADRATYLRRPDLGRRLDAASRETLAALPAAHPEIAFVIADGLSAEAVNRQAVPVLRAALARLGPVSIAPVALVEGGRVAIGDEIGGILGAELAAVLIGERPGLSAPRSLGIYLTWQPAPGTLDAARNCISNIHPAGLGVAAAAETLASLIAAARRHRLTGLGLSRLLEPRLAAPIRASIAGERAE